MSNGIVLLNKDTQSSSSSSSSKAFCKRFSDQSVENARDYYLTSFSFVVII